MAALVLVLVVALHNAPTLQHMAHHDFITPCHPLVFSFINPLFLNLTLYLVGIHVCRLGPLFLSPLSLSLPAL
ncbi:hypothetical protein BGY98DRAFT_973043 [Russula aff. rugulosa BPL654]|nr:hypothetical protein BGY98DRAFT_973043 [Russula aff. rugulosa BPL654]